MNENNPFGEVQEEIQNPFAKQGEESDGITIITKNNRANVVGSSIFARVGNVLIHAPKDCSITINEYNSEVFIEHQKTLSRPEERQYVLLFYSLDDDEEEHYFEVVQGRQTAFDYIKDAADDGMDLKKSIIITETTDLRGSINCYDFARMCIDKHMVDNEGDFDPDDYLEEDDYD